MADTSVTSYKVWDVPVRLFHWINFLSVLTLIAFGLVIYNGGALGLSNEGKALMKTLHVWAGYVFAVNLAIRLVWAFMGNAHARWSAILPGGRGYGAALRATFGVMAPRGLATIRWAAWRSPPCCWRSSAGGYRPCARGHRYLLPALWRHDRGMDRR